MQAEDGDIEVTELPLRKWTQDYKEWLDSRVKPDKEAKDQTAYIQDYKCAPRPVIDMSLKLFHPDAEQ